jgi:hypothetical protein
LPGQVKALKKERKKVFADFKLFFEVEFKQEGKSDILEGHQHYNFRTIGFK